MSGVDVETAATLDVSTFDYSHVWADSLLSRPVTVHQVPDPDNIHRYTDQRGRSVTDFRTRCGALTIWRNVRKADGAFDSSAAYGVALFNTYAAAIDAHYCRRCWRDQETT